MSLWSQYGQMVIEPDELTRRRLERRVLDGFAAHRDRGRHRRLRALVIAAAALAAMLLAVVLVASGPRDAEPSWVAISTTSRVQQVSLPHDGALWVGVDSRVEVAAADASGAVVRLHEGEVTLHVHAGEGWSWRVEVDEYAVEAIGTRFRVRRTDGAPAVHVDEGSVRVTGPGQPEDGLLVHAGAAEVPSSSIDAAANPPNADAPRVGPRPVEPTSSAGEDPPPSIGSDAEPQESEPRSPPRWIARFRGAIAAGDDAAAVAALPAAFPNGREPLSASDYLDAGDALASRRDPERANAAYRAACRRSDAPACGVATFRRALMASRRGAPREAIALATRYLDRHPDGSLAREVLGRRMLWQSVYGSADAARADARTYLARWPRGPHGDLARQILGDRTDDP